MRASADDTPDPLDIGALRAQLDVATLPRLAGVEIVDRIDSTNSELLRRRTPARGLAALFAEAQDGGRGRHGRIWQSPPGSNLYLSVARCFDGDLSTLSGLSIAAGIAAAEAMHALGVCEARVKWPNDLVVVDGGALRKLGGVLVEGGVQDGRARAVVGIGLNVRMPDDAAARIDQPWTDLHRLVGDALPTRNRVAAAVLDALASTLETFARDGLRGMIARFDALDALHGRAISAIDAAAGNGDAVHGIADGLCDDGAMRVRTDDGPRTLRAGEVRVRLDAAAQA